MAVGILRTLVLSSMERHQNPNPDHSPRRKRSRFQQNAKYDNKPYHGKQRQTMVLAPTRILKRGEVLDERTGVDFNESEKKVHHQTDHSSKQIRYWNSNFIEFYAGLTAVDSPHPSSVPLPTFLGATSKIKLRLPPDLQMD
ncbi:hypothetical protein PVL29_004409 [Vitis rotundifolia]|uniref:Uncharacterized protein n=1 Tax=Vitis rotundifolia TaxID=103349 RepID=A0AA39AA79_VITRO|nr:hypothetical protein PVL29_004409 [Vitis rotundifolia]